jgi:hypothetical protein
MPKVYIHTYRRSCEVICTQSVRSAYHSSVVLLPVASSGVIFMSAPHDVHDWHDGACTWGLAPDSGAMRIVCCQLFLMVNQRWYLKS